MKGNATTLGLGLCALLSLCVGCEFEAPAPVSTLPATPTLTLVRIDGEAGARSQMGSYDRSSGRIALSEATLAEAAELAATQDLISPKVLLVVEGNSMVADENGTASPQRLLKHGSIVTSTLIDMDSGRRIRFSRMRIEQEGEMAHVEPPTDLPPS